MQLTFENAPPVICGQRVAATIAESAPASDPEFQVRIRFVSPAEIARLHETFKGKSGPTNVLTFESNNGADIAVCTQIATQDAAIRGWDPSSEIVYLCVHGVLHALGFEHGSRAQSEQMRACERRILAALGIDPAPLGADRT